MSARRRHTGTPRRNTLSALGRGRAQTRRLCPNNQRAQRNQDFRRQGLVFVVVLAVSRMPASVVHVVDVIPVRDGDMTTPLTVDMLMLLVYRVAG